MLPQGWEKLVGCWEVMTFPQRKRGKADFDTSAGKSDGELELWLLLWITSVPLFQLWFPAGWAWDSHIISDCHPGFKLFYPKKHKF